MNELNEMESEDVAIREVEVKMEGISSREARAQGYLISKIVARPLGEVGACSLAKVLTCPVIGKYNCVQRHMMPFKHKICEFAGLKALHKSSH